MNNKNFEYDSEVDSLTIHASSKYIPIAGSISIGNLICDIGENGDFVSLEIDNASKVFNINPKLLMDIQTAKIGASKEKNMLVLAYNIQLNNQQIQSSLIVPKNELSINA